MTWKSLHLRSSIFSITLKFSLMILHLYHFGFIESYLKIPQYIYIYIFMTRHRKYFNIRDYVLSIILSIYQNIKCKMKNIWNIFMIYYAVFFIIYVIYMLIYSIYYIIRITYYIHIFIKLICKQSVCRNSHSLYKKI